jgi:type I restriction enzyme M protein
MTGVNIDWITNFIWGIADDVLRDLYVRGKYRDVILPMTVLRRLDTVLEPVKDNVRAMKDHLDQLGLVEREGALRDAAGHHIGGIATLHRLPDIRAR